jgi:hypothetical protein
MLSDILEGDVDMVTTLGLRTVLPEGGTWIHIGISSGSL